MIDQRTCLRARPRPRQRLGMLVGLAAMLAGCGAATRAPLAPHVATNPPSEVAAGGSVDVDVFGEWRMSGTYRVAPDGTIDFPLLGPIAAVGQSPKALASTLQERLRAGYLRNPRVSVGNTLRTRTTEMSVVEEIAARGGFSTQLGNERERIKPAQPPLPIGDFPPFPGDQRR